MKNMNFDQIYKRKWFNMLKRSQNFRLRRAKHTTDIESYCLKIVCAKILPMEKCVKKHWEVEPGPVSAPVPFYLSLTFTARNSLVDF